MTGQPTEDAFTQIRRHPYWRAVAFHEAAHAVAWLAHGYRVRFVGLQLCHPDGRAGCCLSFKARHRVADPLPDGTRRYLRVKAVVCLAGYWGEQLCPHGPTVDCIEGCTQDMTAAIQCLVSLHGADGWQGQFEPLADAARELVVNHRGAVACLAEAIVNSPTLTLGNRGVTRAVRWWGWPTRPGRGNTLTLGRQTRAVTL